MNFCSGIFSAAVAYSTAPRHWLLVGCEPGWKCFSLAREVLLRQSARAAFEFCTYVSLSEKRATVAEMVADYLPGMTTDDPPWTPPDELPLYHCLNPGVMACVGSPRQDGKLVGTQ